MLPRVSRTFAINIRLLGGSMRDSVRVAYLLCRTADALEDSWPGEAAAVEGRFSLFRSALSGDVGAAEQLADGAARLAGGHDDLDLVAHFPRVRRTFAALPPADRQAISNGVEILASGMCRYAARAAERARDRPVAYLDSELELRDYCWVVAGCVGVMLTHLFSSRATRASAALEHRSLSLAPAVGEALQLTNILLDWPLDLRRGRCYVPADWLAEFGLMPPDLVGRPRPGVREIAARLETLARAALARVPDYLDTIPERHVRYRLFCLLPALWALGSLRHARRDPEFPWGPRRPRLPRGELWRTALASMAAVHRPGSLRRLYAGSG